VDRGIFAEVARPGAEGSETRRPSFPLGLLAVVGLAALDLCIPVAFACPAAVLVSILGAYAISVAATTLYVPSWWNEVVFVLLTIVMLVAVPWPVVHPG
jgi:hypothetical protein